MARVLAPWLAMAGLSVAAAADPPRDLSGFIDLALAQNPATRAEWAMARAAAGRLQASKAPYFPKVSVGFVGGSDQWYTPAAVGPDNFRRTEATVGLRLEFLLFDFGRRSANVRAALASLDAANLHFSRELQRVVFEVQSAYFRYERAVWERAAASELVASTKRIEESVRREFGAGLASRTDWLRVAAAHADAVESNEAAAGVLLTARGELCIASGLRADTEIYPDVSESVPDPTLLMQRVERLMADVAEERPDLLAARSEVGEADALVAAARADFFPEVRLEGSYRYSAFGYSARAGEVGGTYQEGRNGYGAFLVVDWDLFEGFSREAKLAEQKELAGARREKLRQAVLSAGLSIWTARNNVETGRSAIDAARARLASAAEEKASVIAAREAGLSNSTDLAISATRVAKEKVRLAAALSDYSTAVAALALAVGRPTP